MLSPASFSYEAQTEGALCQAHAGNSHEEIGQEQPAENPCSDFCCGARTMQTMAVSQYHSPGVTEDQQMLPTESLALTPAGVTAYDSPLCLLVQIRSNLVPRTGMGEN